MSNVRHMSHCTANVHSIHTTAHCIRACDWSNSNSQDRIGTRATLQIFAFIQIYCRYTWIVYCWEQWNSIWRIIRAIVFRSIVRPRKYLPFHMQSMCAEGIVIQYFSFFEFKLLAYSTWSTDVCCSKTRLGIYLRKVRLFKNRIFGEYSNIWIYAMQTLDQYKRWLIKFERLLIVLLLYNHYLKKHTCFVKYWFENWPCKLGINQLFMFGEYSSALIRIFSFGKWNLAAFFLVKEHLNLLCIYSTQQARDHRFLKVETFEFKIDTCVLSCVSENTRPRTLIRYWFHLSRTESRE